MRLEPSHTPIIPNVCVVVTAAGSDDVHLAVLRSGADRPVATLCRQRVAPVAPTRHFHEAGCCACALESLARGIVCAQETAQVVVNLRRFYDRSPCGERRADGRGTATVLA